MRQLITFTVTAPPAGVLGFDFIGAAAAGADSDCARAGAATSPNSAAAIVTAKMIRLLMNLLPALEPTSGVREHGDQRWRKKSREVQGRNAAVLAMMLLAFAGLAFAGYRRTQRWGS